MSTLRNIGLALALTSAAASAHAGVKASAVSGGLFTSSNAEVFVPLNNVGATTLNFNLAAAGKKVLTFSAYCAVNSPAGYTTAWLDVDIVVNGVVVAPTPGSGPGGRRRVRPAGPGHPGRRRCPRRPRAATGRDGW